MRGLEVRLRHEHAAHSGCNPLIRPSGAFSQKEKVISRTTVYS